MSKEIYDILLRQWLDTAEPEELEDELGGKKWLPVQSSNLAAVAYDKNKYQLWIAFLDGSVYVYDGVPEDEYFGLMKADSHGEYFVDNIRLVYPYERRIG